MSLKIKKNKNNSSRAKLTPMTIFMLAVLCIYVVMLFGLFFYGVITALKCGVVGSIEFRLQYLYNTYGFPNPINWNFGYVLENFVVEATDPLGIEAPTTTGLGAMFGYSILYALGCAFFNTFIISITAYACARFPYKFSKIIHTLVIVVMIIPIVGNTASEMEMAIRLGLYNRIWGMWIMRANFLGMYFLVFYDIFKSLPKSYTEAAKIDGAGNASIMFRIMYPLILNTFLTVLLINFIVYWNDYQVPLLYLPSYPTAAYGLYLMSIGTEGPMTTVPMRMTAAIIVLIPILVVFLCTQKHLLKNLTVGGVKG